MAVMYVVVCGLLILCSHIYRIAYPRPYPGIPYHRTSSQRYRGDAMNMLKVVGITQEPSKFLFEQCRKLNSPVIQLFLAPFSKPSVFIDDVREVKDILNTRTKEFDRPPRLQKIFRPLIPHCSLVKPTGLAFKSQRRQWEGLMGPTFLRRVGAPKIWSVALELVELLKTKSLIADGRAFYFVDDFDIAAFEVIWKVAFGEDLDGVKSERNGILAGAECIIQPASIEVPAVFADATRPEIYNIVCFLLESVESTFKSMSQPLHYWFVRQRSTHQQMVVSKDRIINALINDTRRSLSSLPNENLVSHEESSGVVMGVRRQLLSERGLSNLPGPTQGEISDELLMLLIGGHETVAKALTWVVKFLTAHPEKQSKLRAALVQAYHSEGSHYACPNSAEEILGKSIPYLDACIEETLRLGNISAQLARVTTTDADVLGYHIPKGVSVNLNPYVGLKQFDIAEDLRSHTSRQSKGNFHMQLDLTDDMEEWAPERWLVDEDGSFNPRKFPRLAFSAGPRVCYGRTIPTFH
ncbi:putative Cytochrome P450 [Seiridium cardinale]